MRVSLAVWSLSLLILAAGGARARDEARPEAPTEAARALVQALAKEDFRAAGKDFDDTMKKAKNDRIERENRKRASARNAALPRTTCAVSVRARRCSRPRSSTRRISSC